MTTSVILVVFGAILLNVIMVVIERKTTKKSFVKEWTLDGGVTSADEYLADGLLMKYGRKQEIVLGDTFTIHKNIRDVIEQYATVEFDDYTMDYDRREFLKGEDIEVHCEGFYCIGGDGGEIVFYVRKSNDDERIYAFDMEGSVHPEPYASNFQRFIVMRFNAWSKLLAQLADEPSMKNMKKRKARC